MVRTGFLLDDPDEGLLELLVAERLPDEERSDGFSWQAPEGEVLVHDRAGVRDGSPDQRRGRQTAQQDEHTIGPLEVWLLPRHCQQPGTPAELLNQPSG